MSLQEAGSAHHGHLHSRLPEVFRDRPKRRHRGAARRSSASVSRNGARLRKPEALG